MLLRFIIEKYNAECEKDAAPFMVQLFIVKISRGED